MALILSKDNLSRLKVINMDEKIIQSKITCPGLMDSNMDENTLKSLFTS